ncbi:MAG: Asp-tRNA(Asn)/Glu-tRNA(Gln) amidotransferase C subunit [Paracrocinitomix sp.]
MPDFDIRRYTVAMAELLGIDLEPDEIEPVATQIERVAELVDRLPRLDDDALTMAPRFRP